MPQSSDQSLSRRPRQDRSRAREQALLSAAARMLQSRPFEAITVAEIADAAATSVGGFYARFENKEGLLQLLDERIMDDCLTAFDRAMSDEAMRGASVETIVAAYVRVMVTKFREHRTSLIQIIHAAKSGDPAWAARTAAFNRRVHGRARALLSQHAADVSHTDPARAITLGLAFVSAAARETVLGNALHAHPVEVDDEQLIRELTALWARYLGVDARNDGGR